MSRGSPVRLTAPDLGPLRHRWLRPLTITDVQRELADPDDAL